jgi:hypothetical protein
MIRKEILKDSLLEILVNSVQVLRMANSSIERGLRHQGYGQRHEQRPRQGRGRVPPQRREARPLAQRRKEGKEDIKKRLKDIAEEKKIYYSHPCRRGWHTLKKYIVVFILLVSSSFFFFEPNIISNVSQLGIDSMLVGQVLLGLAIIIIIILEIVRSRVRYYITKSRVVEERGILSKKVNSLHMSIVDTIKVKTNIIDRLLKMGDLEIVIIDSHVTFSDIHDPNKVEDLLIKIINEYKSTHRIA